MKFVKLIIDFLIFTIKAIYNIFAKLTKCDSYDIMEIIGFGLVVNSLYGLYKLKDLNDLFLLIFVLLGTIKIRHKKREEKC